MKKTEGSERGKIRVSADGMGEGEGEGQDDTSALHDDIAILGETR